MKLAIFSDIHGNYQATKSIIDDINKSNFDEVICLGDLIGIGPKSKESLELVMKNNVTIYCCYHDEQQKIDYKNDNLEEIEICSIIDDYQNNVVYNKNCYYKFDKFYLLNDKLKKIQEQTNN